MLKVTCGIWRSDNGHLHGTFSVLGKKFVVFINDVEIPKEGGPEKTLTIQEDHKNAS
jgi:hypothetical protein